MFDGEWRTAFIKARQASDRSTTARRRSRPLPTIPRCTGRPASAARSSASPRARSIPTRRGCWSSSSPPTPPTSCRWRTASATCPRRRLPSASPDLTLPPQFDTFLNVWANPKSAFAPPTDAAGQRLRQPAGPRSRTKWQAGKISDADLHSAAGDARPADRRTISPRGRRRSSRGPAGARTTPRTPAERRRARRRAQLRKYGTVLLFLSPWIFGFVVFTAGPMLLSLYYSFTHYDL